MRSQPLTRGELPTLAPPWIWIGNQDTGWIASYGLDVDCFRVEASVVADDGIQICASVNNRPAHAPLVVIVAVAVANGSKIAGVEIAERDEIIQALSQRCVVLAAESASFEARWRQVGEQYAAERARRQLAEFEAIQQVIEEPNPEPPQEGFP